MLLGTSVHIDAVTQQQHIRIGQPPPAPKRRPWLPWTVAAIAVGLVLALAAGLVGLLVVKPALTKARNGNPPPTFSPAPFAVNGFMTLRLGQFTWDKDPDVCSGWRGYDDIHAGTQVVVTDPAGTTIAIGALGQGVPRRDPVDTSRATECRLPLRVAGVPGGHQFYGLEVGRRGKLDYPRDRIDKPLELTL